MTTTGQEVVVHSNKVRVLRGISRRLPPENRAHMWGADFQRLSPERWPTIEEVSAITEETSLLDKWQIEPETGNLSLSHRRPDLSAQESAA